MIKYLEARVKNEPLSNLSVALGNSKSNENDAAANSAYVNDGDENVQLPAAVLAGSKRLRRKAFNAVKKGEIMNSAEFAFTQRPCSPKNYRIYSDK